MKARTRRRVRRVRRLSTGAPSLRVARLLTAGDDARAEDVVQTTLTRLYLRWRHVRRADNPFGYARTSLTHVFIDESRRAHRRRELSAEHPLDDGVDGPERAAGARRTCDPVRGRRRPGRRSVRASARSSSCATGSTSTSPRPHASSAAAPARSSPRTPAPSSTCVRCSARASTRTRGVRDERLPHERPIAPGLHDLLEHGGRSRGERRTPSCRAGPRPCARRAAPPTSACLLDRPRRAERRHRPRGRCGRGRAARRRPTPPLRRRRPCRR